MRVIAALTLSALAAAGTAAASSLSVAPIRVELSPTASTAVLTVHNQGDAPVVVQARPAAWSQQGDHDQLDDTRDVLVTPPLFTIAAGAQQTLRIALLRRPDPSRELDYRLVLSEVPPVAEADGRALRIALRITLPVFIAAPAHTAPDMIWQHHWRPDGTLEVQAQNRGTAHIQILDFDVRSDGRSAQGLHADKARYLLPGTTGQWELSGDPGPHSGRIVIHGHSDAGDFTVTSDPGPQ